MGLSFTVAQSQSDIGTDGRSVSQSVSQSVSLGVDPHLGLLTRYLLLFDSHGLVFVGRLSLSLILRPTVSRRVCLSIKHPFWAYDQIFITLRQLRVC
jgi:hypothetical protein